ncbi:MAG TPA: hypothetical protein VI685_20660 [Candidatus Angelobacter sp.]
MKNATLYFHYPCFDGLVSGVLAWEFLEKHAGWTISNLVPVDYTLRGKWLVRKLRKPCAVVDFLYHPRADFWADHHKTSMLGPSAKASYRQRKNRRWLFYDDRAPSCAGLLYHYLRKSLTHRPHFEDLVNWAQKIDSAAYSSVGEAILGDAPALQINRSLLAEKEGESEYARFLITELRSHDLSHVAALKEVKHREQSARRSLEKGLKRAREKARLEDGSVVIVDTRKDRNQIVSRYAPYSVKPDARYSIGIVRSPDRIGITAMRNPWRKFRSVALGRAMEKFGGGGHQRVGAVQLPAGQKKRVADVVESLLFKMRDPKK